MHMAALGWLPTPTGLIIEPYRPDQLCAVPVFTAVLIQWHRLFLLPLRLLWAEGVREPASLSLFHGHGLFLHGWHLLLWSGLFLQQPHLDGKTKGRPLRRESGLYEPYSVGSILHHAFVRPDFDELASGMFVCVDVSVAN